jgi:EpsI family protein
MTKRLAVATFCLVMASIVIGRASKSERVAPRASFATFPVTVGEWSGQELGAFEDRVLRVLGVDDYLNRVYVSKRRAAGLYIGYYRSQRQGDTIHSPLNCLPGAGWEPVSKERVSIAVEPNRSIEVNEFVIEKGLDRQVVVYWYQSHGRVVASEYVGKAYLVLDALRLNRTDGAIVRIVAPVNDRDAGGELAAASIAREFTTSLFPLLSSYLPG